MVSRTMRITYAVLLFASIATACFALFSPDWWTFKLRGTENTGHIGLWKGFTCRFPSGGPDYCDKWFADRPSWERSCKGLFIAAIGFTILGLFSSLVSFLCYDSNIMRRIMMFWLLPMFVLYLAGIIVFFVQNRDGASIITGNNMFYGFTIGYSIFIMCGAFSLIFSAIFVLNIDIFLGNYSNRIK